MSCIFGDHWFGTLLDRLSILAPHASHESVSAPSDSSSENASVFLPFCDRRAAAERGVDKPSWSDEQLLNSESSPSADPGASSPQTTKSSPPSPVAAPGSSSSPSATQGSIDFGSGHWRSTVSSVSASESPNCLSTPVTSAGLPAVAQPCTPLAAATSTGPDELARGSCRLRGWPWRSLGGSWGDTAPADEESLASAIAAS